MFVIRKAVGQHEWRLAMVEEAKPDDDGNVRTIVVAFRPRHRSDTGKPYVSKTAQRLQIGVQRFGTVLMAEEELKNLGNNVETSPQASRDDVKLGLGVDSPCPPSPLLHEVKLPGLVAGGSCFCRMLS